MRFLRSRPLLTTLVLVIVLILIVSSTAAGNALAQGVGAAGGFLVPVQRALYQGGEMLEGSLSETAPAGEPSALSESAAGIMDYEELVAENERLRAMLEYKESNVHQELKVAQITGKEPGNWFEVFTIDIGAGDGIAVGMPVITPNGLVGSVAEVNLNSAKVITIIDARSSVSAIMERTRDTGVVKGAIGSDDLTATLTMNYLPLDTDVIEGDVVLTSGYDEVYPKGLIIGTVVRSADETGGKLVTVDPSVDFRRLEEVMVVVRTTDETPGQESAGMPSEAGAPTQVAVEPVPSETQYVYAPSESPTPEPSGE